VGASAFDLELTAEVELAGRVFGRGPASSSDQLLDGDHLVATGAPVRLVRAGAVAFDLNANPAATAFVGTGQ
jgi:hypothetical protein